MGSGISTSTVIPFVVKTPATTASPTPNGPAGSALLRKASIPFSVRNRNTSLRNVGGSHKDGNIQEEANSFKAKAGTLKMLIKNKNSRKAFFTFLEKTQNGKEELLDYFLFIESIRKVRDHEQSRSQFIGVINKYAKESENKESENNAVIIYSSTHTWKDIKTLPPEELVKHMVRSQDEVLLALTPLFESFLVSNYFKEVGENEMANERKSYGSSAPLDNQ